MDMRYFFKLHRAPIIGALACTNEHKEGITFKSYVFYVTIHGWVSFRRYYMSNQSSLQKGGR